MVSLLGGGLFGNPLSGALGDKEEKDEKKEGGEEEDPEIAEARREAEEKRNEKYRKMEEERETMRQGIRDSSLFPKNLDDLSAKVQELPGKVMTTVSGATEKCCLQ
jgi:complexin-1/2